MFIHRKSLQQQRKNANLQQQCDKIIKEFSLCIQYSDRLREEVDALQLALKDLIEKAVFSFDPVVMLEHTVIKPFNHCNYFRTR